MTWSFQHQPASKNTLGDAFERLVLPKPLVCVHVEANIPRGWHQMYEGWLVAFCAWQCVTLPAATLLDVLARTSRSRS